jgi:Kef-type K+ transport system membrane component KefB/predicted transcriptional regulator
VVRSGISVKSEELNIILLIGIAVFCGTVGAWIIQKFRIPQIIGYVIVGVIVGPLLGVFPPEAVGVMEAFNVLALGVIGFLVGGELKREVFVKFGRQVWMILLFEGVTAFLFVGVLTFSILIFFSTWQMAVAVSVVFAAICSATDPASTVSVLWEYKSRGPLTAILTAIVALDDALALLLYAVGVSVAGVITRHEQGGLSHALTGLAYHIPVAVFLGGAAGLILIRILKKIDDPEKLLAFTVGTVLLVIGIAIKFDLDVILATMTLGVVLVNIGRKRMASCFNLMQRFSVPIYILFFVFVGALLKFELGNVVTWLLVAAYVIGSIVGKTSGAYLGAVYSKAVRTIRNYLGFCLYPQGGIAVGLLILASQKFDSRTSAEMLLVVIIGAFILQMIGPLGVKFGAKKAGELGLNVTEQDLIRIYTVADIMDTTVPVMDAGMTLSEMIRVVGSTDSPCYPVVDMDNKLTGLVTLNGIRNTFATQELNEWLIALDIVEPVSDSLRPDVPLSEALDEVKRLDAEFLPVTAVDDGEKYLGVLDVRAVYRRLSAEVLAKQKEADRMYGLPARLPS